MKETEKILKALANRRRLVMIQYLRKEKEAAVGGVANHLKLSFKATSRHLNVLYSAGIVDREQRNVEVWYRLSPTLHPIAKFISNSLAYLRRQE
ncbi:MAG: hypothetical protein A2653_02240 [Candidatus Zambryskibacteria bacterium RIFCSPHIGHO2_01_FULL_43_25]|uniref:HTH arsR-type domain-containing protein n=1 Tax=Candidatus Zambryskibacteria bacterium RIFCSPLOWO2_01_FULL_45_21 TaxID=1802761 RepID=A0A1G2U370_9BACT|nr:MAG: hypothetical protein A2653_02240 [Candidatus Zambryskibacteria bacterium RIFCSPHIGHO2_01_FULL_43_25]OHB01021.1 MAG: hypothetical protein A3E94_02420 [Candidatus Zambryskibacteria bacterium RIFCSPHIGHO2_12_FULL_44_12b]OHB03934.1 MAG: hypothetical protein A3B14_01210 [Candidatus Zambryskibacteria bacterium RIFCSPLOWO2_01_FULL_45_21]